MTPSEPSPAPILVLAPVGRDAELICEVLTQAGLPCHTCADVNELREGARGRAGALLLTSEALTGEVLTTLEGVLASQPAWSDLPLVLLSGNLSRATEVLRGIDSSRSVTVLERPLSMPTLVTVMRSAVRARRRQYEICHLLERLEELNGHLEAQKAELTAANTELEAFSYSVSHDLRAPLRSLDGFSRVLIEDYGAALDDLGHAYLERIRAGAQRMNTLIDDLLGLARLSRRELKRRDVDLSAVAQRIADTLREGQPERSVQICIAPELRAYGDERLLAVALENLLSNAWKFTVKTARPRIEVGMESREGEEVYFVRDNGAGFDMAHAGKLFTPFGRLHRPQDFDGTGIGLATVQRVVRRHGGRIWAEGVPDRGATFSFTLARERSPEAAGSVTPSGDPG